MRQGGGTPDGMEAALGATAAISNMYGVINRLSTAVAQTEWKLYRKSKTGNDEDRVEVLSHAAIDVWEHPNPFMTRQELVEVIAQHLDLTGEGWTVFSRMPNGWPAYIWPMRPDRCAPVPDPVKFLAGYTYTAPGGETVPLDINEVMFIRIPDPRDYYRGLGPVPSLMASLDASKFAEQWNANWFRNDASPGGIVEIPTNLPDADWEQLNKRWDEQHRGVSKSSRVAFLEGGAHWQDVASSTHRNMQFVDLRTASRDQQYEAFGLPGAVMGVTENSNRAVAQTAETTFARWLQVPRLDRIKRALNHYFLPLFYPGMRLNDVPLEWDYVDPIPGDFEEDNATLLAQAQAALWLEQTGYDLTSIQEAVGLPEMEVAPEKPAPPVAPPPVLVPAPGVSDTSPEGDSSKDGVK